MTRTLPDKLTSHPLFGKQERSLIKDPKAPTIKGNDGFYTFEDERYYVKAAGIMGSIFESMTTSLYHIFLGKQSPEGILLRDESTPSTLFFGSKFAQDYVFIQENIEKFHPANHALHLSKFEKVALVSCLLQEGDFYGNGNIGSISLPNNTETRLAFRIDFGQAFLAEPNDLLFTASSFLEIMENLSRDFRLPPNMATYQGVIEALEEIASIDQSVLEKIFTDHFNLMEKTLIEMKEQEIAVAQEIKQMNQLLELEIDQLSCVLQRLANQLNPVFFDEDAEQPEPTPQEQAHLDEYTKCYDLYTQKIVERNNQSNKIMEERLGCSFYLAHRHQNTFEERLRRKNTFLEQLNKLPELIRTLQQAPNAFTEEQLILLAQHQDLLEKILPAFEAIQACIVPLQQDYAQTQSKKLVLALINKDPLAEETFENNLKQLESLLSSEEKRLNTFQQNLPYQVGYPALYQATQVKIELQSAIVAYNQTYQKVIQDAREAVYAKKIALMNIGNHPAALFSSSAQAVSNSSSLRHQ